MPISEIAGLAQRLPVPCAADALGLRRLVVHPRFVDGGGRSFTAALGSFLEGEARLRWLGEADGHAFYALTSARSVATGFDPLAAGAEPASTMTVHAPEAEIAFRFRAAAADTYRHPDPIAPTPLVVRWYRTSGELVAEHAVRALLPLALAPKGEATRSIRVGVPAAAGSYEVALAPQNEATRVLARVVVVVGVGGPRP